MEEYGPDNSMRGRKKSAISISEEKQGKFYQWCAQLEEISGGCKLHFKFFHSKKTARIW